MPHLTIKNSRNIIAKNNTVPNCAQSVVITLTRVSHLLPNKRAFALQTLVTLATLSVASYNVMSFVSIENVTDFMCCNVYIPARTQASRIGFSSAYERT